jgi:hypothetical protein
MELLPDILLKNGMLFFKRRSRVEVEVEVEVGSGSKTIRTTIPTASLLVAGLFSFIGLSAYCRIIFCRFRDLIYGRKLFKIISLIYFRVDIILSNVNNNNNY